MANILPVQNNIKGTLDLDSEFGEVRSGNYVGAENVQFISKEGNESIPKQPFIGNKLLFDKGRVEVQNKRFRLFFDLGNTFSFQVFGTNNVTQLSSLFVVPSNASYAAYRSAIQGFLTSAGLSSTITIGTDHLNIEITSVATYDYQFRVSNASAGVRVIVTQESVAANFSGFLKDIGSFDLNGDLFIFSTPQEELPEEVTVSGVNSAGVVTTVVAHGLSAGDEVRLAGSGANDGILLVNVVLSATTFSYHYPAGVATVGGVITKNYTGVGEIGVAQFNEQAETGTYTRLLRSKEFGFNTLHQIDCDGEINPLGKSLYFNQYKFNPPRVFYYSGAYVTDGALTYVVSENRYEYGSIDLETRTILNIQTAKLDLVSVSEGGNLKAGNKQYFIRFLTSEDALSGTDYHAFTGNVNIYKAFATGDPNKIAGNVSGTITSKKVTLRVENAQSEFFGFVELCVAEWFGDSVTFSTVRREEFTEETFEIEHTGFEVATPLSTEEVLRLNSLIKNIGGQRIVDNRLVMHDITYEERKDFRAWAERINHTIIKEEIAGNGFVASGKVYGGYQNPQNTFRTVGYKWFETYRFGIRLYLKEGGVTETFWIDDIKFDIAATNVTTPNRRVGTPPPNYELNVQALDDNFFVPGVDFSNIDLEYLIDGRRLRDIVGKVEFMRVELGDGTKEILANGMGVIGMWGFTVQFQQQNLSQSFAFGNNIFENNDNTLPQIRYPFPFFSGQDIFDVNVNGVLTSPFNIPGYRGMIRTQGNSLAPNGPKSVDPFTMFLISNDVVFGKQQIESAQGDQIINFGRPLASPAFTVDGINRRNFIRDFRLLSLGVNNSANPYFHNVEDAELLPRDSSVSINRINTHSPIPFLGPGQTFFRSNGFSLRPSTSFFVPQKSYVFESSVAVSLKNPIYTLAGYDNPFGAPGSTSAYSNTDEGVYWVSYYRPKAYSTPDTSKFGDRKFSKYVSTGISQVLNDNVPSLFNLKVFGGDTFIGRTQLKLWNNFTETDTPFGPYTDETYAMSFVAQSTVSPEMRTDTEQVAPASFPATPTNDYKAWLTNLTLDSTEYDTSYNFHAVGNSNAYNETRTFVEEFPSRVIWSDLKPDGSFFDSYRFFPPGQFNDYSRNYGPVVHIETLDDEFFVMQHRNFSREYFNTTGTISSDTDELVILGNAGVLARKGATITSYGSLHKWSCVKGRSASGRDVLYWFNAENGLFLKYGGRGAEPLSMAKGLNQWFNENSKFVYSYNTPAAGRGICGGWNERFQELRYTFRGYKNSPEWGVGNTYDKGDVVIYGGNGFVPVQLYLSRVDHISSPANIPGGNTVTWEAISEKDSRYYNVFTLVYNEMKDGFTSFLSPKPLIYHRWRNNLLTQRYGEWSQYPNYLENFGDYNTWYSSEEGELAEDGFVIPVINYNSDVIKKFSALYVDSEVAPDRVEFFTPEHESFLVLSDFESREGMWVSTIKNDILTAPNGINDGDTSRLFGRYLLVKVFFSPKKFQSLRNIRVRLQFNSRYLQT
jgi:hypothetical protein